MSILRHDDGSLTVPVEPGRHDEDPTDGRDGDSADEAGEGEGDAGDSGAGDGEPETMVIRPGEGGYVEALAEWEAEQHPDQGEAVSTASGRSEAMSAVHSLADDRDRVSDVVDGFVDRSAVAEALRHVLVGGTPSIDGFAGEVAEAEGGEPVPEHTMTGIIGELLAEIDSRPE